MYPTLKSRTDVPQRPQDGRKGLAKETWRRIVPRQQKEKYALGIITLFPSLKDPFSPKGYEHFYDGVKNTGFLSWRLRTMSRKNRATGSPQAATVPQLQGPKRQRPAATEPLQLDGDACREAIYFLVHSPDEAGVFEKMKLTLQHRQDLVRDAQRSADVFKTFPRFLDVKGLAGTVTWLLCCCSFISCHPQLDGRGAKSVPVMQWKKWFTFTSSSPAKPPAP
ncbi:unnamed protein product [Arctogadus glacialis]